MVEKGGPGDPVAQNIRNQQNHDAMPSGDEIERKTRKEERVHAQWKAVEALFDSMDTYAPDSAVAIVAGILNFDELARRADGYSGLSTTGGPDFRTRHEESWEKSDDWPPDHPQARPVQPFDEQKGIDVERVRRLKQEAFLEIQDVDPDDFAVASRRVAPFGNNTAVAVEYRGNLHTNDTWDKVFSDEKWSDRFDEDDMEKYRTRLEDELAKARSA